MFHITFNARVGEQFIKVEIAQPLGAGGGSYHISEDGYFCGSIVKREGQWIQLHKNKHEFTIDDIQALGEVVDFHGGG